MIVIAAFVASIVSADLTVYCKDNSIGGSEVFGGLAEYEACLDCDCYVFDLLCLE